MERPYIRLVLRGDMRDLCSQGNHITECIKKTNKRLYFIVLLKRANVPPNDIVAFYCIAIRPVLEDCAQVYHHVLPQYLSGTTSRGSKKESFPLFLLLR